MSIIVTRIVVNSGLSIVLEKQVGAQEFCVCILFRFFPFTLFRPPSDLCRVLYSAWRFGVFPPPLLASFTFLFSKWPAYYGPTLLSSLYQGLICFVFSSQTLTAGYGYW